MKNHHAPHTRTIAGVAFVVGVVGGIYGIGGGSILGPILVGTGMTVARVAPAALASTFVTSIIGVAAYASLAGGYLGFAPAFRPGATPEEASGGSGRRPGSGVWVAGAQLSRLSMDVQGRTH